ncbi:PREDICTED: carcinine transporter [Nicrophorus vespilloides]|uniref:Carcinine transporter n=1 Tax=Nicrophorus vespilloides TaxID=110193 RepID=A0ABM1M4M7_NICVS|nr:PREDICTED: carcinine transporter [Nicrophorus vespilloides]
MDHNDESKHNEPMDLDDILPQVGEFGTYQKCMLWFVCLPACFPCGFGAFNQLFMADVPDHWCWIPQLANISVHERIQLGIPQYNDGHSKCTRYKLDWSYIDNDHLNESQLESCLDGWEYNKSEIWSSIVIDFDLVCEKDLYPTLGLVALNVGGPIGVYFFGWLNDKIGRKKSFFMCLTTLLTGGILTATAKNFWWWAGSRTIVGLTIPAIYQIPFIISLELVGPNFRSFVTVMTCMFYSLGIILLAGITYMIRDWVILSYITCIPFSLYYVYIFFLPESPRWLLTKGRFEEASRILEKLAEINKKELPVSFKQELKHRMMVKRSNSEEEKLRNGPGLFSLCRTPNMRLKTILITLNWFATEMVYVGLSYYGPALGNNQYLSFTLSCAVEIPSYLMCWLIIDRWGRRWPLCLSMIISGISCIATVLLPQDAVTATLILYLISKFAIAAAFLIIYPFSGELYPTEIRGIGIGISSYIGGLGLIIIPFITYLGSDNLILPLMIMGMVSVIGGVLSLRLPETLHHKLPQSIEEGEEFGKDFGFEDCVRCIPLRPAGIVIDEYEDLEMNHLKVEEQDEETPLGNLAHRTRSVRSLAKQNSFMDTQKDLDGTMKMTYWF